MTQFDLSIEPYEHETHAREDADGDAWLRFALRFIFRTLQLSFYATQRVLAFALYELMQRPFASVLCALCLWAGLHVGDAMRHQNGPHPAPLFAKKDVVAKTLPSIPEALFQASYETPPTATETVDVRAVQQLLSQKGFYKGAVDGRMGPMTAQAVRDYQTQAGLETNGVADQTLLESLQDEKTSSRFETDDILIFTVQNRLNQLGFDAGAANGKFNAKTRAAIETFETAQGLPPTGSIGAPLLRALTKASLKVNS